MVSVGTHNLHDETGRATGFAAVLFFTESIPDNVADELPVNYIVAPCRWQKDLIIAWDPRFFRPELDKKGRVKARYHLNNTGIAKVSPHRGTYWIKGSLLIEGEWKKTALICAHWVNAAFPPYIRGEGKWRRRVWRRHQKFTVKLIRRLIKQGYHILGGGDLNTPRGVEAFEGMARINEVGDHFDRVFSTYKLTNVRVLSNKGSDHPRLFADAA